MQVSKVAKQYIQSINNEIQEDFHSSVAIIKERVKKEVLGSPLLSSNLPIRSIIESESKNIIETAISILDYYVEGVYHSGKLTSRAKLKLKKVQPLEGQKYAFTSSDIDFIEKYKSHKLDSLKEELEYAVVNYLTQKITNKINGRWNLDEDNDFEHLEYKKQELVDDEMKEILEIIENTVLSIYDEFIEALVREVIVLFKRAQIEEFKNLGINTLLFLSEDESLSCPVCNAKSGKVFKYNDMIDDLGIQDGVRHAFCKFSIDPVISYKNQVTNWSAKTEVTQHSEFSNFTDDTGVFLSNEIELRKNFNIGLVKFSNVPIEIESRIDKVVKKFQIYAKDFLREIEFKFVDNITDLDDWVKTVEQHYISAGKNEFEANNEAMIAQDKLKYRVSTFSLDNVIYVSPLSLDSQPIENMIVREILKPHLKIDEWVTNRFNDKKEKKHVGHGVAIYQEPFISYLAEESDEDYLLESTVYFVNYPKKLQMVDKEMFNYIKDNIFNSVQFF